MDAEIYNQPCIALSFFPSGINEKKETKVEIDNHNIILSRYRKTENGITIRLFNSSDKAEKALLKISKNNFVIDFSMFEVRTFNYKDGELTETDMLQK